MLKLCPAPADLLHVPACHAASGVSIPKVRGDVARRPRHESSATSPEEREWREKLTVGMNQALNGKIVSWWNLRPHRVDSQNFAIEYSGIKLMLMTTLSNYQASIKSLEGEALSVSPPGGFPESARNRNKWTPT
ncbi:hypothetical protein [Actinocorallia aurantiaca]